MGNPGLFLDVGLDVYEACGMLGRAEELEGIGWWKKQKRKAGGNSGNDGINNSWMSVQRDCLKKHLALLDDETEGLQSYLRWRGHCKGEKVCRRDRILYEMPNKSIEKNEDLKKDEHGCL